MNLSPVLSVILGAAGFVMIAGNTNLLVAMGCICIVVAAKLHGEKH